MAVPDLIDEGIDRCGEGLGGCAIPAATDIAFAIDVIVLTWIAVRLGMVDRPQGMKWGKLIAASFLAGIGFTKSRLIAALGFGEGGLLEQAAIGILAGSVTSGVTGFLQLRAATSQPAATEPRDPEWPSVVR